MLLLPLLLTGALAAHAAPIDRAEAERLARAGEYAQALDQFRQLAAANPDDLDARVWIGRLHVWTGRPRDAEPVFRGVLDTAPDRQDALIGLGVALSALGRHDEAIAALDRAEKQAPTDPDVLTAKGRAHFAAGHHRLAEAYLQRAILAKPDPETRRALEAARRANAPAIEAQFVNESYNVDLSDTRLGNFTADFRMTDALRVQARVDAQRKFGVQEARGGGGLAWQVRPRVVLRGQGLLGGTSTVLPRGELTAAADFHDRSAIWTGEFRYFRFANTNYWVFRPAVSVAAGERAMVTASYSRSVTEFPEATGLIGANAGDVRLHVHVVPRLWVSGGYARNVERLDTLSPDRLGDFRANTGLAGGRFSLGPQTTIGVDYEYQRRANGVTLIRVATAIVQSF
jgi:YaiO family outer membrane protein